MIPQLPVSHAPGVVDHALIALTALLALTDAWWYWPRIMRALGDRVPGTRMRVYRNIIVVEWAFTAAVVAWWIVQHRAWAGLHVGPGRPVATAVGALFVAGYFALALFQIRAVIANPERLVRFAARQAKTDPLAPRTTGERRLFVAVALTAGVCEEFFHRGFALWYFTQLAGPVAGFALSAMLFGLVHLYLGRTHAVRTALLGVVFGLLVVGTGSLWPAIVLHVGMDLIGGAFSGHAFRVAEQHGATAATSPA